VLQEQVDMSSSNYWLVRECKIDLHLTALTLNGTCQVSQLVRRPGGPPRQLLSRSKQRTESQRRGKERMEWNGEGSSAVLSYGGRAVLGYSCRGPLREFPVNPLL